MERNKTRTLTWIYSLINLYPHVKCQQWLSHVLDHDPFLVHVAGPGTCGRSPGPAGCGRFHCLTRETTAKVTNNKNTFEQIDARIQQSDFTCLDSCRLSWSAFWAREGRGDHFEFAQCPSWELFWSSPGWPPDVPLGPCRDMLSEHLWWPPNTTWSNLTV